MVCCLHNKHSNYILSDELVTPWHLLCITSTASSLKMKRTLKCLLLNLSLVDLPSPRDCFVCKSAAQHRERIHISSEMSCLLRKLMFSAVGTSAVFSALCIKTGHLVPASNYLSCSLCSHPQALYELTLHVSHTRFSVKIISNWCYVCVIPIYYSCTYFPQLSMHLFGAAFRG